jgi:hypothetical protein
MRTSDVRVRRSDFVQNAHHDRNLEINLQCRHTHQLFNIYLLIIQVYKQEAITRLVQLAAAYTDLLCPNRIYCTVP